MDLASERGYCRCIVRVMDEKKPPEKEQQTLGDPVKDRIVAKLVEKQGSHPVCPVCHFTDFVVAQFSAIAALNNPNEGRIGGATYPFAVLFCQRCGTAQFINLLLLGFTQEDLASLTLKIEEPPHG